MWQIKSDSINRMSKAAVPRLSYQRSNWYSVVWSFPSSDWVESVVMTNYADQSKQKSSFDANWSSFLANLWPTIQLRPWVPRTSVAMDRIYHPLSGRLSHFFVLYVVGLPSKDSVSFLMIFFTWCESPTRWLNAHKMARIKQAPHSYFFDGHGFHGRDLHASKMFEH